MKNVVPFNIDENIKFVAEPVWIDWIRLRNKKEPEKKQLMVICLKDMESDNKVIHPLSEFILSWYSKQFNTMRKHCMTTVSFLNFVLIRKKEFKINSLNELLFSHGNRFLNEMTSSGKTFETVKDAERTLTKFFHFLSKKNSLLHIPSTSFHKETGPYGSYLSSPFSPIYPGVKAKEIEHFLPPQFLPLFFEIALIEANPILLGIYFQMFGGLRVSEVLNITRPSIKRKLTGEMVVSLNLRNLRSDLRTANAAVKRPRQQRIYSVNDWLELFYENHINTYKSTDGSGALFVNRNGQAMTESTYRQYFNKVKTKFIQSLKTGNLDEIILGNHLEKIKWSTHIGRGTFSNQLAEIAENPYDLSQPRGDKSLMSSLSYLSGTQRMKTKMLEKFQNMHTNFIPILIERKKMKNDTEER
ncbi:hypothetical protein MKX42_23660 [Paenibacillus sp. FSL R7-0204]|uniref:hypothetical protein n=1 Tax=Paenibacillus sp. FSL R7-0204 TaxID=2921675 RepID=UPI0030F991F4